MKKKNIYNEIKDNNREGCLTSELTIINHNLFSNYYLENLLPITELWKTDAFKVTIQEVFEVLLTLYTNEKEELSLYSEANLENRFIRPILDRLGHSYDVQVPIVVKGERKKPDYAFFIDGTTRKLAQEERRKTKKKSIYFKRASLLGEAKRWGVQFDTRAEKIRKFDDNSPSFQLLYYMNLSKCNWGLLTNGRIWRLYHREHGLDTYLSIDLVKILEERQIDNFRYFFFFFSNTALKKDHQGYNWLDRAIEESIEHKKSIGINLRQKMIECIEIIGNGFLQTPSNNLESDKLDLAILYDSSLVILYRLLFILYGEYRGLLPIDNNTYRENFSLYHLRYEIKDLWVDTAKRSALLLTNTQKWEYLSNLFHLLNKGSEALKIPSSQLLIIGYNGGLFNPEKYSFIEDHKLNDIVVCELFRLLTWVEVNNGLTDFKGFLDYSELSVRHLGSIYEALLEFHFEPAKEDMVVIQNKKHEYISKEEAEKVKKRWGKEIPKGSIYLANEKLQRKITGSYYTKEPIVNFMVNKTIGQLTRSIRQKATNLEDYIQKLLSLKIIDPAMGSGHFLVSSIDFIANEILSSPLYFPEEDYQLVKDITDQKLLLQEYRQIVAQNCIYGVDKNYLAVELAKVSIWIHTAIEDRPLHFLDHHLKCGDSLLGASLDRTRRLNLEKDVKLIGLDEFLSEEITQVLINGFLEISKVPDKTVEDMKEKERRFLAFQEIPIRLNYSEVCDVYLNHFLGERIDETIFQKLRQSAGDSREYFIDQFGKNSWYINAKKMKEIENFFHWELEFPDVFLGKRKGFDVCIGNPPHGAIFPNYTWEYLLGYLKPLLGEKTIWKESGVYFALRCSQLIHSQGVFSFILPKPSTYGVPYEDFRTHIMEKYNIIGVYDIGCAFEKQLQEQYILLYSQSGIFKSESYQTGYRDRRTDEIIITGNVPKSSAQFFRRFFLSFNPDEIEIGKFFATNDFEDLNIRAHRGVPTKYRTQVGIIPLYEKRDIGLGHLKKNRFFVDMEKQDDFQVTRQQLPKIITQRILSYQTEPLYSLNIYPYVDINGEKITQETAINIYSEYPPKILSLNMLAAILSSDLVSWYLTRFVYSKRFETSKDFDEHYIQKIRIPKFRFSTPTKVNIGKFGIINVNNVAKFQTKDILVIIDHLFSQISIHSQESYNSIAEFIDSFLDILNIPWKSLVGKKEMEKFYKMTPTGIITLAERNLRKGNSYDKTALLQQFKVSRDKIKALQEEIQSNLYTMNLCIYQLYRLDDSTVAVIQEALGGKRVNITEIISELTTENKTDLLVCLKTGIRKSEEHEGLSKLFTEFEDQLNNISDDGSLKELVDEYIRNPIFNQEICPRQELLDQLVIR